MAMMLALGTGGKESTFVDMGEEIWKRYAQMERELRETREREAATRRELERTRERLRITEEAEERLCSQLGDLEAESVEQASAYSRQIKVLLEQISVSRSNS